MTVQELYQRDKDTLQHLKDYFDGFIDETALKMLFDREDVSHLADAKDLIMRAFDHLEMLYAPKPKRKVDPNEAR